MNFPNFFHALITCYMFFTTTKCQTMLLAGKLITEDKPKRSTQVDNRPNNIVKKMDQRSPETFKPVPQKLKPAFITTIRPIKPFSLPKGVEIPMPTANLSKDKNKNMTNVNSVLRAIIKAGLERQGLVKHKERITEKKKDSPDLRVKEKYWTISIPHSEPPQLPNANILDMAPAKGSRIRVMRLKGRLCHRHVLFPEGPKYDHEGRPYMGAHQAFVDRVGKEYHFKQTHPPHFLLPSCCNCCKKSMFGCK